MRHWRQKEKVLQRRGNQGKWWLVNVNDLGMCNVFNDTVFAFGHMILPVLGFRKYRERVAVILSVHDNWRSVQKLTTTGQGVQNTAEGRHDHRQFRRYVFTFYWYTYINNRIYHMEIPWAYNVTNHVNSFRYIDNET